MKARSTVRDDFQQFVKTGRCLYNHLRAWRSVGAKRKELYFRGVVKDLNGHSVKSIRSFFHNRYVYLSCTTSRIHTLSVPHPTRA